MLIPNKHSGYRLGGVRLYPGAKGSDAPAPDPRLVEAQIKSMGIQDDAIKSMLSNTDSLLPLQKEQMQFGLDAAKTAYGQSQDDRGFALQQRNKLTGLTDSIVADARGFDEEGRRSQLVGQANADVTSAFDSMRGGMARNLARNGVNPADGASVSMERQTGANEALAKVLGARKATDAAHLEGIQLKSNATNVLSGYPGMATGLTTTGATLGGQGLNVVNTAQGGMNSGFTSAGSMAGSMGSNAAKMWGAEAEYKTGQDRLGGSIIGTIGGIAGAASKVLPFIP